MDEIISADRDYGDRNAVGKWTGNETARPGERRNTEVWHAPREREPSKPLCGARLAGKLRRTKGSPNCGTCLARSSQHVGHHHFPVLRALARGEPVPPYAGRHETPDELYEHDLVFDEKGRMALTDRGKLVAADIIAPIGWLDRRTGIYHARNALRHDTLCHEICSEDWGSWNDVFDVFRAFRMLMAEGRKHKNRVVTCVHCAIHVPPRHVLD